MQRHEQKGRNNRDNDSWSTVNSKNKSKRSNKVGNENEYIRKGGGRGRGRDTRNEHGKSVPQYVSSSVQEPIIQLSPPIPPIPPVPTGPNYASVTKRDDNSGSENVSKPNDTSDNIRLRVIPSINPRGLHRQTARNQVPRPNNRVSYDVWERTYFKHILDLAEIFSFGAEKLGIKTDTIAFLDVFSNFIRHCSSGEISPFIEDIDEQTDEFYFEYTIKRNK